MGTKELQVFEFEIKELTPAKIVSNINDLEKFMIAVKEKYDGWIVIESDIDEAKKERTNLNKLEKIISSERKRIQREANADIETIINNLKTYEKETKKMSDFIGEQLKRYNEEEWENKKSEIKKIINKHSVRNEDIREFIIHNENWKNKNMALKKIEDEIIQQYEELNKKKDFILTELEKANNEIEFKIVFESVKYLMSSDYTDITKTIENKKNEIKQTEENLRQKAEEEKQRELAELEAKKEKEKQEALKNAQIQPIQSENETDKENIKEVENKAASGKFFDTTIRFKKAPLEFLKELKKLSDSYELQYQLIQNIEL